MAWGVMRVRDCCFEHEIHLGHRFRPGRPAHVRL